MHTFRKSDINWLRKIVNKFNLEVCLFARYFLNKTYILLNFDLWTENFESTTMVDYSFNQTTFQCYLFYNIALVKYYFEWNRLFSIRYKVLIHQDTDRSLSVTVTPCNARLNWDFKFIPLTKNIPIIRKFHSTTQVQPYCRKYFCRNRVNYSDRFRNNITVFP